MKRHALGSHFIVVAVLFFALSCAVPARIVVPAPPALSLQCFAQPTATSLSSHVHLTIDVATDPRNEDRLPLTVYFVLARDTEMILFSLAAYKIVPRMRPVIAPRSGFYCE